MYFTRKYTPETDLTPHTFSFESPKSEDAEKQTCPNTSIQGNAQKPVGIQHLPRRHRGNVGYFNAATRQQSVQVSKHGGKREEERESYRDTA